MSNWFNHHLISIQLFPIYILTLLFCPPLYADNKVIFKQISLLEKRFISLSSELYQKTSAHTDEKLKAIRDIDQLHAEINRLVGSQQTTEAIQLLYLNINTATDNIEDKAIFSFTELLLKNNERHLANSLLSRVQDEDDNPLLATIQFSFAKYHAERLEWSKVIQLLDGMIPELSLENAAYANLLNGYALQHLKKHRRATESYNKIPASSQYYAYAQLNIAIADIRQGWWTDAQSTINNLVNNRYTDNSDELSNRLYLIMGYALLQNEYYRDAREAFRHIGLDSFYTNRALLAIALAATSQGDFVGGLNALSILKDKNTFDLSVDESYLLVPYVYEKLQQELTVTAAYSEALAYYKRRMKMLETITKQHTDFSGTQYNEKTASLNIDNNSLNYGKHYPESFINNYRLLIDFLSVTSDSTLRLKIEALISKYDAVFQEIISDLVEQRKEYLKSYLNQSRYGLARLYDKSNEAIH